MSFGMLSRWPVIVSVPVSPDERGAHGELTDQAIERIFAAGRSAYFELCKTVDAAGVVVNGCSVLRGAAPPGDRVTVSVNVIEVYPDTFTMSARIRPAEGDGIAATGRCSLTPGGPVTDSMRDEFIALAQSARRTH